MHAIVLAAGAGSRLRDVTPVKPLLQLRGKPLIQHVVGALAAGGATSATVVVGYHADAVAAAARGSAIPLTFRENPLWETTPNGISVLAAAQDVTGPTLLSMADHLLSPGLVQAVIAGARGGVSLGVDRRLGHSWVDEEDVTRVRTRDGQIVAIGKQLLVYDCYDTGLFVIQPALVQALAALSAPSLSQGVASLAREGQAHAIDIGDQAWLDIDDARAQVLAEAEWAWD